MREMSREIYRSPEFPYPHFGLKSGHIEVDLTDPRRPTQRHIWRNADGTHDYESWIDTIHETSANLLAKGWKRV